MKQVITAFSEYDNELPKAIGELRLRERATEKEESKTFDSSDKGSMLNVEHFGDKHQFSIGQSVQQLLPGYGWFVGTIEGGSNCWYSIRFEDDEEDNWL